ncbi:P22 phage major capsid protein family protein [Stenotrophomonas indicatrix]|uniref:P22 phage major capsid protein family protein n=1 Tax=Stenotrophomonas indicatrix TaxID=2045451 RepID=UPI0008C9582A|nr:P22 phage major capsid protein family protein [Stenotrophomonas indicatrix]SET91374.1 P22 coat protein-gene protein 5 [Stenotrophomonas indicatrix]SEU12718.1 P22 coat protein-gene protein 5 [Stenotrophomonas indicatrix]
MANQFLTTQLITREILSVLRQKLTFLRKINMEYKGEFAVTGAKIGDTVNIRVPTHAKIRSGRIMDASNMLDKTVPLTISDQNGVDLVWNSSDMALKIDDFSARYLDQPIADLASRIEQTVLQRALPFAANFVANADGKLDFAEALRANKVLTDNLAPTRRFMVTNTSGTVQVVDQLKGFFNAQDRLAEQYEDGLMARAAGFDWFETTNMPAQAYGTSTIPGAYLINGANQTGSSIAVDGGTGTLVAGQHVTFAGVFAVNPATKVSTGVLQTFVVTANYAGGNGNIQIAPAIVTSGPEQNVTASPADNAVIVVLGATAQTGVNLGFARDFLTFATVDLPLPENKEASRMQFDGLSLRMIRDYDTVNDQFLNRVDILWGSAVLRPEFGVVIPNDPTNF